MVQKANAQQPLEGTTNQPLLGRCLVISRIVTHGLVALVMSALVLLWLATLTSRASLAAPVELGPPSNLSAGTLPAAPDISLHPNVIFHNGKTSDLSVAYLSANKFVVAFCDTTNPNYGKAVVGEIVSGQIKYGPAYTFNSDYAQFISVAALTDSRFVVVYRDTPPLEHGKAVVGTVSGNSISFSSEFAFHSAAVQHTSVSRLEDNKFIVAYQNSSNQGTARVGTYSSGTISYGAETTFGDNIASISVTTLKNWTTRFVVAYKQVLGPLTPGYVKVGVVYEGTNISFNPEVPIFNNLHQMSIAALDVNHFVIAFKDIPNMRGSARVGYVSTFGSVSLGDVAPFSGHDVRLYHGFGVARLSDNKFVIGFKNQADDDARLVTGTVSLFDDSIVYHPALADPPLSINPGSTTSGSPAVAGYDGDFVVCWSDWSDLQKGKCIYNGDFFILLPLVKKD